MYSTRVLSFGTGVKLTLKKSVVGTRWKVAVVLGPLAVVRWTIGQGDRDRKLR